MEPDILVVDDDRVMRQIVVEILRHEDYVVAEASNGLTALLQLEELGPPGLVLLDLRMPDMDGWEVRQGLLADPALAGVPVVIMTAESSAAKDYEFLQPQGWLFKPVEYDDLLRIAAYHCRRREGSGASGRLPPP